MEETPDGQVAALSLERYAEVVAHLLHFKKAPPFEVLARLGVDARTFAAADRAWSRAMGDELSNQETALALRFAEALAPPRRRLEEARPTLESIAPLPPEHAAAPAPAAEPEPVAEPEPIAEPPVVEAPVPVPVPHVEVPTFALPTTAPERPLLPTALAAQPPSSETSTPTFKRPSALGGTALTLDVPRGPAMPFVATGSVAPAPAKATAEPAAQPPPAEAGPPAQKRAPAGLGGTALALDAPRGPALPFGAAAKAEQRPAPPPAASPPAALTIEQYASFCVELEIYADRPAEVLARYRLTAADRAALDEHYRQVFAQRPMESLTFQRACASYKAWLQAQAKR